MAWGYVDLPPYPQNWEQANADVKTLMTGSFGEKHYADTTIAEANKIRRADD